MKSVLPATLVLSLSTMACKSDPPRRGPPPPAPTVQRCDAKKKPVDSTTLRYFPADISGFCLDPLGSERSYGKSAQLPLERICDLFDGECEIYKRFKVRRVVEARYIDGKGTGATIDVYLSKFVSSNHAYGMFTKRVVGDGDPAHPDTPRALDAGDAAALGVGNAYLWRGQFLAELTYNDDTASVDQIRTKADALLAPLARALGKKIPSKGESPNAVTVLPTEYRLPLGVRYLAQDMLNVSGTGPGAYGYYRQGDVRWRVLSIAKDDVEQAKDVLSTLRREPGARKRKRLGHGGVRLMHGRDGSVQTEWLIARKGTRLVGIGDESRVLRTGMTAEEHGKISLSTDAKAEKLKALLDALK